MIHSLQRKLELDARGQRREKNYMAKNLREIRHKQAENRRKKQVEDGPVPDRPSTANTTGKYAHVGTRVLAIVILCWCIFFLSSESPSKKPSRKHTSIKYNHTPGFVLSCTDDNSTNPKVKSRFREQLSPQRAGDDENSGHEAHPREGKSHSTGNIFL